MSNHPILMRFLIPLIVFLIQATSVSGEISLTIDLRMGDHTVRPEGNVLLTGRDFKAAMGSTKRGRDYSFGVKSGPLSLGLLADHRGESRQASFTSGDFSFEYLSGLAIPKKDGLASSLKATLTGGSSQSLFLLEIERYTRAKEDSEPEVKGRLRYKHTF